MFGRTTVRRIKEGSVARFFAGLARLATGTELPVQVAAVCYRLSGSSVEFLLVNTSSGKWTFPKGRLCPALSPSESAAREAWEEAGVHGRIEETHFAHYLDTKARFRTRFAYSGSSHRSFSYGSS
jgi:8-oxo-dGTP pyrophosphatase MutT (NUDIX family)